MRNRIKFVNRAKMFCRTEIIKGKQVITWHLTREDAQKGIEAEEIKKMRDNLGRI